VLLGIFAGLALLVAATGLFGVLSYAVSRRTQEIGVRMALGARPSDVLGMVMAAAGRLLAAGLVLGLAAAWGTTRLLRGLLFEVTPADPLALGGAVLALVVTALAATAISARRAARVDPMVALRHEP
jgi:ABC-type antimicrobial peptide transport system permease subunit